MHGETSHLKRDTHHQYHASAQTNCGKPANLYKSVSVGALKNGGGFRPALQKDSKAKSQCTCGAIQGRSHMWLQLSLGILVWVPLNGSGPGLTQSTLSVFCAGVVRRTIVEGSPCYLFPTRDSPIVERGRHGLGRLGTNN